MGSNFNFVKNVLHLSSGTSLAYLVTIAISPILTRMYSPEDFGLLQFFQSSIIISTPIITGCYYYALVTEEIERTHPLFKGIIILSAISTIIITVLAIIVFSFLGILSNYLLLIVVGFPLVLFANAIILSSDYFFIKNNDYTNISISRIIRSVSTGFFQVGCGASKYSSGLLLGFVFGKVVQFYFYLTRLGSKNLKSIFLTRFTDVKKVLKQNIKQPLFILPSTLVSSGATELIIFIIASIFGGYELGLYALAYRVISIPSLLIGTSIGDVFFKESSSLIQESKSIIEITIKTWYVLFGIAVIPMASLWLYGPEIITIVFGSQWEATGAITKILAPYILFSFMSSSTGKLFISLEVQNYSFYFSLMIFVARISGLLIGYSIGNFLFAISLMIAFHFIALIIYNTALFIQITHYEKKILKAKL